MAYREKVIQWSLLDEATHGKSDKYKPVPEGRFYE
jgi:hypothetical protein